MPLREYPVDSPCFLPLNGVRTQRTSSANSFSQTLREYFASFQSEIDTPLSIRSPPMSGRGVLTMKPENLDLPQPASLQDQNVCNRQSFFPN
jgi:hypothetical protein